MDTKKFSLGISILLVAVFVTPLLLKQPALWSVFDLSRDSNLATSISGFITPVLTFLSIILIFFAFTKQIEANKELHEQTLNSNKQVQIEIINSLLNQINNEINSYAHLKNDEPFVGRLAFQEIGDMVMNGVKKNDKLVLSDYAYGEALVSVANLYLLIFKEINIFYQLTNANRFIFVLFLILDLWLACHFSNHGWRIEENRNILITRAW